MQRGEFTLSDLTELAGVSARTVRYYISEGLLPPPESIGSRATYSQSHLDRLLLIGQLKDAYLPLREIRRQLNGMSESEISRAASRQDIDGDRPSQPYLSAPAIQEWRGDASDYIRRVLEDVESSEPGSRHHRLNSDPDARGVQSPRNFSQSRHPDMDARHDQRIRQTSAEPGSWRRIELSPDAELLIREDAYERNQSRIEWLINWAQRVFR